MTTFLLAGIIFIFLRNRFEFNKLQESTLATDPSLESIFIVIFFTATFTHALILLATPFDTINTQLNPVPNAVFAPVPRNNI